MKIKIFIKLCFIFLAVSRLQAQIYPVSNNIVMPFPQPMFLFDYYNASSSALQITLQLNDMTVLSHEVKIKFVIESGDIKISTKDNYIPSKPIILTPGMPKRLQGSDLYDALNINNLNLKGINKNYLLQNAGKLPEGHYNFCVTTVDYKTGKELSLPGCMGVFLQTDQPPTIISPECGSFVTPSNPQNIQFNWQVSSAGHPGVKGGFNTYKLILYEITDPNIANPQNAVPNSKAVQIYESQPGMLTNLNLDFSKVLLHTGKKYVFRIQAIGPNGKQTFANDGYSNWCWFNYGYPEGGIIETEKPFKGQQFTKNDQKVFSWGGSDKGSFGQKYKYTITIVEQTDTTQSLDEAIQSNPVFIKETMPEVTSQDGGNYLLNKALEADTRYVWKIEAHSGNQKVAESESSFFFSHSGIEKFYASNREIKVVQITENDPSKMAGKARIQLSEEETDFIDVNFEGLTIKDVAGKMILSKGEINFDISGRGDMEISPEIVSNGTGFFEYISGKIDKTGLKIIGKIKWILPHAVVPGEETEVISKPGTFVMDSEGKLTGEAGIEVFKTVLLSPKDFKLTLNEKCLFQLAKNEFSLNLVGSITLPESVKNLKGEAIEVHIKDYQQSLDYVEIDNLIGAVTGGVVPINNLKLEAIPTTKGIIDLSEDKSPGKLGPDKLWKGFYVTNFKVRLHPDNFDPTNQVQLPERIDLDINTESSKYRFWVSGTGLNLKADFEFIEKEGLKFNSFQTEYFKGDFDIKKSKLKTAKFNGRTKIPFIDEDEDFEFEIPATEEGLEEGNLSGLEGKEFTYNPYGGENKMDIKINRFVFVNNQYLSCNIDVDITELGALIERVEDFRIYGDYLVGIQGRNTSKVLDEPVDGRFKQMDVTIVELGAAFLGGKYAMSYAIESNLSEGITDVNGGPPRATISSVAPSKVEGNVGGLPEPQIEVPKGIEDSKQVKEFGFEVIIETPMLDADAYLNYVEDDPKWGTRFKAGLNALIKVPARYKLGGNMALGFVDGMDYWYFDAYFEDKDGTGIEVILETGCCGQYKLTSIVGVEGQIFRHVKSRKNDQGKFELALSENTQFGAKMYLKLLEPYSRGFIYQADLGLEAEIIGEGSDVDEFEATLSGEASFLNINVRTGTAANVQTAMAVAESAGVADEIIDGLFPQTINVNGTDITLDSKGIGNYTSLELGNYKSGNGVLFGANVLNNPGLKLGLAQDNFKIGGGGDASGSGELDLEVAGIKLGAKLKNQSIGQFKMNIDGLRTSFSGDYSKQKADFSFDYNDVALGLNIDKTKKAAGFLIGIDDVKINAKANMAAKSADFDFKYGDKKFGLGYNGNDEAVRFLLQYGDFAFNTAFNTIKKQGSFRLSTSLAEIEIAGSRDKAQFTSEAGSFLFDVESNFKAQTGKLKMAFPNHELSGEIGKVKANIFLKQNDFEIGLGGRYDGTAGDLHLKEGDFIFDIGTDLNKSSGYLTMGIGQGLFSSKYDPNGRSFVKLADNDFVCESVFAKKQYKAHYKTASHEYLMDINPVDKNGQILFKVPDFEMTGEFIPKQSFASTELKFSDNIIKSSLNRDSSIIQYNAGNRMYRVAGSSGGSGSVFFSDNEIDLSTSFSFDKSEKAGSLYYRNKDFLVDISGNKTTNFANLKFAKGPDNFHAGMSDSLFVQTTIDNISASLVQYDNSIGAGFSIGNNRVSMQKYEDGGSLNFHGAENNIKLTQKGSRYELEYLEGNLGAKILTDGPQTTVGFSQGNISIASTIGSDKKFSIDFNSDAYSNSFSGNLKDAGFSTSIKTGNWTGSADVNLSKKEYEFECSDNNIAVKTFVTSTQKDFNFSYGDLDFSGGFSKGEADFNTILAGTEIKVDDKFKLSTDQFELNLSMEEPADILITLSGNTFRLIPVSVGVECNLDLNRNNIPVPFTNNSYSETIEGKTITVSLQDDNSKTIEVQTHDLTVFMTGSCDQLPEIQIIKGSETYVFKFTSNQVILIANDIDFKYNKQEKELLLSYTNENSFKITETSFESSISGYRIGLSNENIMLDFESSGFLMNENQATLSFEDRFIELNSDETCKVWLEEGKYLSSSSDEFEVRYDTKKLSISSSGAEIQDTDIALDAVIADNGIEIKKDDYYLTAEVDNLRFQKGEDFVDVASGELSAKYDNREMEVTADKMVTYKDASNSLEISEEKLKMEYGGKSLEVLDDGVKIEFENQGEVFVNKQLLSFKKDNMQIALSTPIESPKFEFNDGDNRLGISEETISMKIGDYGIITGSAKFGVLYKDNSLTYGQNDLKFKFDNYEGGFTDWKSMYVSNGIQKFSVSPERLSAALDENNSVAVSIHENNPTLELKHEKTRFAVTPNQAELDYEGLRYVLSKKQFLKVQNLDKPNEYLNISEKGISYLWDNREINISPKGNLLKLRLDNKTLSFTDSYKLNFTVDKYVTTINKDLSATFTDGKHVIELNQNDYMAGYRYTPEDVFVKLKRFDDSYVGLVGGIDTYSGFVKAAKENSIEVGGNIEGLGQTSIAVNKQKDVGINFKQSDNTLIKVGIEKAKTLDLAQVKLNGSNIINFGSKVDAYGEGVEGIEAVSGDGPSHISNISQEAGGWAMGALKFKGTVSENPSLIANGRMQTGLSVPIFCGDVPFGAEIRPGKFLIKVADKNRMATMKLLCAGGIPEFGRHEGWALFGFEGTKEASKITAGVGYAFTASVGGTDTVRVGTCKLGLNVRLYAKFGFGGMASLYIPTPDSEESLKMSLDDLYAHVEVGGRVTAEACKLKLSASAYLSGSLQMKGDLEGASASGTLSGGIEVMGVGKNFSIDASVTI